MKVTEEYLNNVKEIEKFIKAFSFDEESEARIRKYIKNPLSVLNDDIKALFKKYDDEIVDYRIPLPASMLKKRRKLLKEVLLIYSVVVDCLNEDDQFKFSIGENGEVVPEITISEHTISDSYFIVKNDKRKVWKYLKTKYDSIARKVYNNWNKSRSFSIDSEGNTKTFIDLNNNNVGLYSFVSVMTKYIASIGNRKTSLKEKINTFFNKKMLIDVTGKTEDEIIAYIKDEVISPIMNIVQEIISARTLDLEKYKLYLSFNVFDWLLASSGQDWHSCIDMDSNYCYGVGMLGMCGCPDWGMLLYTDGSEKQFSNIKVYNIVTRSWVCYTNKKDFQLINWYPKDIRNTIDFSDNDSEFKFIDHGRENNTRTSFSHWDPITFVNGAVAWIYSDLYDFSICDNKTEMAFKFTGKTGLPGIYKDKNTGKLYYGSSLGEIMRAIQSKYRSIHDMVKHNDSIANLLNSVEKITCDMCGDEIDEDDRIYIASEDIYVCENCCNNNFFWDDAYESYYRFEDGAEVYSGPDSWNFELVCSSHLDDMVSNGDAFWDDFKERYYRGDCVEVYCDSDHEETLTAARCNIEILVNEHRIFKHSDNLYYTYEEEVEGAPV